jgi:hypothetical protein
VHAAMVPAVRVTTANVIAHLLVTRLLNTFNAICLAFRSLSGAQTGSRRHAGTLPADERHATHPTTAVSSFSPVG